MEGKSIACSGIAVQSQHYSAIITDRRRGAICGLQCCKTNNAELLYFEKEDGVQQVIHYYRGHWVTQIAE